VSAGAKFERKGVFMDGVIGSLESSGGYAIILGAVVVGFFLLAREWMAQQAKRSAEEIERERANTDAYRALVETVTGALQGNTVALTRLVDMIQPMQETLGRIDRHLIQTAKPVKGEARDA
jgi:hypothetical protein